MKIYRIPRDNDFYIGIPMKMVSASDGEEPIEVSQLENLSVRFRNRYANTVYLECEAMKDKPDTLVGYIDTYNMVCGMYDLIIEAEYHGRILKIKIPGILEILHEMLPGNVTFEDYDNKKILYLETVFVGYKSIYLKFSDIVNNLTEGGVEAVLSAEMGKELNNALGGIKLHKPMSKEEWNTLTDDDTDYSQLDDDRVYPVYED